MLSIAHTFISLPFGIYMQNPILIFIAAFIFHLFADTLLHWNIYAHKYRRYPYLLVAADVLGGIILAALVLGGNLLTLPVLAAVAGGNMPDILHGIWDLLKRTGHQKYFTYITPAFTWHDKLQLETNKAWQGLVSQIALSIIAYLLIIKVI